jgi:hypothetical protein|nr:MAG TPA: hypothetical protein [Bacteriophage sp.]
MKDKVKAYCERLEKGLAEYMSMPVSERSATAVTAMVECYEHIKAYAESLECVSDFSRADAEAWCEKMENADGTTGAHWTKEQTTSVAESLGVTWDHITPWCWWVAMNMMYSDYCLVAERHGVFTAEFYGDLAKAFLWDKDAPEPKAKLAAYYCAIAK